MLASGRGSCSASAAGPAAMASSSLLYSGSGGSRCCCCCVSPLPDRPPPAPLLLRRLPDPPLVPSLPPKCLLCRTELLLLARACPTPVLAAALRACCSRAANLRGREAGKGGREEKCTPGIRQPHPFTISTHLLRLTELMRGPPGLTPPLSAIARAWLPACLVGNSSV